MTFYAARDRRLQRLGFPSYDAYLKSDKWKRIRSRVLERDQFLCVKCGGKATDVHHLDYKKKTLRGKRLESLISLCRSCHEYIEFNNGVKTGPSEMRRRLGDYKINQLVCRAMQGKEQHPVGPLRGRKSYHKPKLGPVKGNWKVLNVGDPCRHCRTPVILKQTRKKPKPGQMYAYTHYLHCPKKGCHAMYMLESCKYVINNDDITAEYLQVTA